MDVNFAGERTLLWGPEKCFGEILKNWAAQKKKSKTGIKGPNSWNEEKTMQF